MKAVVYDKPRSFTVTQVPDPHAGPGVVRLRVLRTGRVAAEGIVTHTFALDDYADAQAALGDRNCIKAVVRP